MEAKAYWRRIGPAALGALLALGACSDSEPGDGHGMNDGGGDEAFGDLADGVAGKTCESDDDCEGAGARCIDTFEVGGEIGSLVGLGQEAPGNYCTATCNDDAQCGEGGVCANAVGAFRIPGQCEKACQNDGDCRDGYVCTSLTMEFEDVDPEALEEAGVGDLVPEGGIPQQSLSCKPEPAKAALGDGVAGKACSEDDDCGGEGGECLDAIGSLFGLGGIEAPEGYCSGDCTEDADCGAGGVCVGGFSTLVAGSCLQGCETNDDCEREGHLCRSYAETSACIPTESLDDGVAGTACTTDADCGETGTCASTAAGSSETPEGGYCTLEDCRTDDQCGSGGVCQITPSDSGRPSSQCAEGCDLAAQDCSRENYVCVTQDEASAALQGIELSPYCQLQAPAAETCDPACADGEVCQDGSCVAEN